MKKQILVVYLYMHKQGSGIGNVDFTVDYDVPSMANIREMERQICETGHFDNVVVLNIIDLAGESEDKG